ncbi:hypothetical protein G7059_06190 [Erysipelothrix sp. HDW6A]|uniref:hypothetical protein n=1 Tax=Erysipelothrix sp. HDW6A TaxID=2714928 RepID=UPI0014079804|nr:hypothetical protein [Erysipelothrix sp. HDW6A]QIK57458.1 hypothetical protein G7059_06190 [Erysipelothrix sp. HDW6A]
MMTFLNLLKKYRVILSLLAVQGFALVIALTRQPVVRLSDFLMIFLYLQSLIISIVFTFKTKIKYNNSLWRVFMKSNYLVILWAFNCIVSVLIIRYVTLEPSLRGVFDTYSRFGILQVIQVLFLYFVLFLLFTKNMIDGLRLLNSKEHSKKQFIIKLSYIISILLIGIMIFDSLRFIDLSTGIFFKNDFMSSSIPRLLKRLTLLFGIFIGFMINLSSTVNTALQKSKELSKSK